MVSLFTDKGRLNLGEFQQELKDLLSSKTEDYKVRLSNGNYLTNEWDSHKSNYYDYDMYISDYGNNHITLKELIALITDALNYGTMTGYKDGNFVIGKDMYVGFNMYGCYGVGTWPFTVILYKNEVVVIVDEVYNYA